MARVKDGYFLTAAHFPHVHHLTGKGYHDPNPNNGRALCILDHAVEEVLRDNEHGARLLLQMGVYHINSVKAGDKQQWYPDIDDIHGYIVKYADKLRYYEKMYTAGTA